MSANGADDPPWLTLSEAAAATGVAREALRARARRGTLPYRQGNRGEWLVRLPAERPAEPPAADMSADMGTAAAAADLVADLRVALARVEGERDAARLEVALMREVLAKAEARADRLEADLRARLDRLEAALAEARRPWWRRALGR